MKNGYPWTDADYARLRLLWDRGLSMALIARDLDPRGRLSRSAVAGKIMRLGIKRAAKAPSEHLPYHPGPRKPRRRKPKVQVAKSALSAPATNGKAPIRPDRPWLRRVSEAKPNGHPVDILAIGPTGCRWPVELREGTHLLCNQLKPTDRPYCHRHHEASYQKHLSRASPSKSWYPQQ